jgi:hypothetical protein
MTHERNLMISMYDKILTALKVSTADSSIVDLFTVYEYVSVSLSRGLEGDTHFKPKINMLRFCSAIEGLSKEELTSSFFDGDKTVYGKLNLGGAMATAGYTPEEEAFFNRCANLFLTRPATTIHVFTHTHEEKSEEEDDLRGTQV